ncbi:MAG: hypothetical protein HY600_07065 [Candidatus Omnitrophica bacterium]|nr:hypothetical protein [Candidatus Omnitrophota bacterium]
MDYVATNIRFPREALQDLKLQAVRRHQSLASLVRDAVEQVYGAPKAKPRSLKEFHKDPIFSIIGICDSGIKDGAVHHDREIYGKPLKRAAH